MNCAFIDYRMEGFLWGALARGFGEGMMHSIDTVKTKFKVKQVR